MSMKDLREIVKKWVDAINNGKLDEVTEDLKNIQPGSNTDKYIFKILLYLSHYTDRCTKENISRGTEIWNLTSSICSLLETIPDRDKFFSSIYFITRYLIHKQMYSEAMNICNNLLSGKFIKDEDQYCCDKYYQLAYIWYTCGTKIQLTLLEDRDPKSHKIFFEIVKYHLRVLSNTQSHIKSTFDVINSYLRKLSNIPIQLLLNYFMKFMKVLRDHLVDLQIPWTEEDNMEMYKKFIDLMDHTVTKNIKMSEISFLSTVFKNVSGLFLPLFKENTEWHECFQQYSRLYSALLRPMEEYEVTGQEISECVCQFQNSIDKYEPRRCAIWKTVAGTVSVLDNVLWYWEGCFSVEENHKRFAHILPHTAKFISKISHILERLPTSIPCKDCESKQCPVQTDLWNAANIKLKCVRTICKLPGKHMSEELFALTINFLYSSVKVIDKLKKMGCKRWSMLWSNCGRQLFNFGISSEKMYPKECEKLYYLLCLKVIEFDGMPCKESSFGLVDPIAASLHRLCCTRYSQDKYREAMTVAAYNGLFNYSNPKTKAFYTWAKIKQKCPDVKNIQNLSMVSCIHADKEDIKQLGITVNLNEYDIRQLCLQEIKSMQVLKGNSMTAIKASLAELTCLKRHDLYFARGVQLLGFHSMQTQDEDDISSYIDSAFKKLSAQKQTVNCKCLVTNLEFYAFVNKLFQRSKIIEKEMDDAKFTLKTTKELRDFQLESNDLIPPYGVINIHEDSRLAAELKKIIEKWEDCIEENIKEIVEGWEPEITLETILISGEYARLYRLQGCEKKSWELAYILASAMKDWTTCTYVTARCISLRYIVDDWIRQADVFSHVLKISTNNTDTITLALYWLSLADFYFDCGMTEEAKQLLENYNDLQDITVLTNSYIYLFGVDIKFRNYHLLNEELRQEEYSNYIVQCHYSMISLDDALKNKEGFPMLKDVKFRMFSYDILFETTNNIAQSMNSLLSFREISAHLLQRQRMAQKLGVTQQVAHCLKNLCYIDLSRHKFNDCEVKLQDLEYILSIENFRISMSTDVRDLSEGTQDRLRNDASPVLRRKAFTSPDCTRHSDKCRCYQCENLWYLYLVFATTSIRAQLYALRKLPSDALQHFHGCLNLHTFLCNRESRLLSNKRFTWRRAQSASVDYALYLLSFGLYALEVKPPRKDEALAIAQQAINFCEESNLKIHPVYTMANEIFFQIWFYESFTEYSAFTVPDIADIEIEVTKAPPEICITPRHEARSKETYNLRRRKSPLLIPLPKIEIEPLVDDKDVNTPDENLSTNPTDEKQKCSKIGRTKSVRRKILEEHVEGQLSDEKNVPKVKNSNIAKDQNLNSARNSIKEPVTRSRKTSLPTEPVPKETTTRIKTRSLKLQMNR